jgi:WhiB family redox-sensing transcriptional regulator
VKFLFHSTNYTVSPDVTDEDLDHHQTIVAQASLYYASIKSKGYCTAIIGQDSELFYSHSESDRRKAASKYCSRCPVAKECLLYAFASREEYGVWGGTLEATRIILLRKAARKAGVPYSSVLTKSFWAEIVNIIDTFFSSPRINYSTKGRILKKSRVNPMYRP